MKNRILLDALDGKDVPRPPVWLMRQAGRYLPEYRALREKYSLSTLFHEPDLSVQVTHMPLQRFPLDAAIVFSDLLMPVELWGKSAQYPSAGGVSVFPKVEKSSELFPITREEIIHKLQYVFQTITQLKSQLQVPLIGFCGAPFTLLCYLLEGKGSKDLSSIRFWMQERREEVQQMLDIVCEAMITYAQLQIEYGADAIQIFDSWANMLFAEEFDLYALRYWKRMQEALQGGRTIFFSLANSRYLQKIVSISPRAISFDAEKPLIVLRREVPDHILVQGNFSPTLLASATAREVQKQAEEMAFPLRGSKGVIFNLGHGVLPHTPIENVTAFLSGVQ